MEDKTSSKLKSMLDSKKIRNIIIVVGLIGIGLIFLSNWVDFGSLTSGKGDEAFSVKTYSTKIENDLQTVISKIEGAGKTEVLLTMENSVAIIEIMRNVHTNNDFFEKILCQYQRRKFRGFFFIRIHPESRLDIDFFICIVYNKVDFFLI